MSKKIDMTGWVMKEHGVEESKLTVIEEVPSIDGYHTRWRCQCECGNFVEGNGNDIRRGKPKSCGCANRINLTGWIMKEHYVKDSKLTVIKYDHTDYNGNQYWLCKCECGGEIITRTSSLINGYTKSCGCVKSFNEAELDKMLINKNINFKREYIFKDLISCNGGKLRFDFAILNQDNSLNCLIEYQGIQHYRNNNNYFGKQQREETDQLKKDYCKKNNILLYEIRYDEDIETKLNEILNKQGLLVA